MARQLFTTTSYSLNLLVQNIDRGEIGLPDLQRPYVWGAGKVRDLLDSMYRGFPVGYLLFWHSGAAPGSRQIGTDSKAASAPRLLVVDGQQRLTSLYSVLTGKPVVDEDFRERRIRIAFNPARVVEDTGEPVFVVADAATDNDPEFLADVSELWTGNRRDVERAYLARLRKSREIDTAYGDELAEAIDRVFDLQEFSFQAVELDEAVQEDQAAEIFNRINSAGKTLKNTDFILTLMSVYWEEGRRELERFSREAKRVPESIATVTPFNPWIDPGPDQMLRVEIAYEFGRGRLQHALSLLRGKDLKTGRVSAESRDAQFARLSRAQDRALDLTNWHAFLGCIARSGHRNRTMLTGDTALLYSYALYLLGQDRHGVDRRQLQGVIARWFFMSQMTGRYSSSPESRIESDLASLEDATTPEEFCGALDDVIRDTLTDDFWRITLPNRLVTSKTNSPAGVAYLAALHLLDAPVLLSAQRVRDLTDPASGRGARAKLERHHLFPKAYLKKSGIADTTRLINQVANFALLEWFDNQAISDEAPASYWPRMTARARELPAFRSDEDWARALYLHAIPDGWTDMSYEQFLDERRRLMAQVVREGFAQLNDERVHTTDADDERSWTAFVSEMQAEDDTTDADDGEREDASRGIAGLIEAGLLAPGDALVGLHRGDRHLGTVETDGQIHVAAIGMTAAPSTTASALLGRARNGWTFWRVLDSDTGEPGPRLRDLREDLERGLTESPEPVPVVPA